MNKDSHQIFETYKTTSANQEIVQEGMFDRLKAKGAGVIGAAKGLGQQATGAYKGAVAGLKGDVPGVQAAQLQKKAGAIQGKVAKVESYRKTAEQKLNKVSNEVFEDLKKLGIDLKGVSPNSMKLFSTNLNKAFDALIADIKK